MFFIKKAQTIWTINIYREGNHLGRDEHNPSKGKKRLAQTPKNQVTDSKYVEFSKEFADHNDKEAQARAKAADQRAKKNS